ncbi:ABC transporter permease [Promethearchaeum syntrophicum]|uniref:ABC transporter permease n=1 Tax=Promethearchaeum syntrophicum TaxID=2594042 RepID=A0A5B9D5W6_9ARCH|nr:FtsX-like permease family protein [Candidatus Prometheoarchaeum syntrophicum]QEE14373.1 FtsX-like permease family protein [Candidatus Prometheoarchaeum syntrophicum]
MIFGYLRKTIWRNKTRTFFLTVGIIVSIMLVTGVNISSNAMAQSLIQERLDEIKIDFTVVPRNTATNATELVDKLNSLEDSLDEFVFAYVGAYGLSYRSIINPYGGEIDWSFLNTSKQYEDYTNTTHFCGLKKDLFSEPRVADRFKDVIKSNDTLNFTQEGVYLDSRTAQEYGVDTGQNISIGVLSVFYDWDNGDKKYNLTAEANNITILGVFNLINRESFIEVFNPDRWGGYMGDQDIALIGNFSYIEKQAENLTNQLEDAALSYGISFNPWDLSFSRKFGVMIDHSSLNVMNINELKTQINQIENKIKITGGTLVNYVEGQLDERVIQELSFEIAIYQAIFLIISVPVIILGWFLTKTNFQLSYEKRRREIALLKVKGGISKQLKSMFFLEALIIGLCGGALGVLGGNLTSTLVLKQMFPQVLEGYSFTDVLSVILYGEFLSTSTWIIGIILALSISLLAVRKPLKEFSNLEPIEGLQKYHEISHAQLPTKKRDWIALIVSLATIVFTLVSSTLMANADFGYGFAPFLMLFVTISTVLLPLAPFLLIYALVKLLCGNIKFFQAIITKISQLWSKQISVFTSKSIIRNQVRSFRLVFIVGMALSFVVMASTIRATELNYQNQMETITTANGIRINIRSSMLNQNGTEPFIDMLWNEKSAVPFETFNYYYQLKDSGFEGSSGDSYEVWNDNGIYAGPIALGAISAENFTTEYVDMSDDWFINMTADEAMDKLRTIPNATLIPESMVQQGYEVGDIYENQIQYSLSNGTINTTTLEVVGVYNSFPIVSSGWNWNQVMIIDKDTIKDSVCYSADFMFYPESGNENEVTYEIIENVFQDFDSSLYAYNPADYLNEGSSIATSVVSFLNLESFYLLIIVTFGIAIIMYISINEKSHDMGLLRARGVEKKVIYKIQIAEGFTLILLGCVFSIVGLLGGATIALHLNTLAMDFTSSGIERHFSIPWLNLLVQLIGSLAIFITSIIIAVFIETRKSNVTKIGDLLRVA